MAQMKLGFSLPTAGEWATPENQIRIARQAESLGYHSLWVFQRLLYALEPRNEYPPIPGKLWPKPFERVFDPIVTLAYVAAVTTRIRLGTSVLIMPFYSPVVLAKQLATLDVLSAGRLNVGLSIGWSEDEYEAVGVPFKQRGRRGDEFLRCLDTIWANDVVEFRGEFYRVPRCRVEPKPVQKPRPPITIGGYGSKVVKRAVELGDGFSGGNMPLTAVEPLVREVRGCGIRAGQRPELASHRLPRELSRVRYAAGYGPSPALGQPRRNPRGHPALCRRRSYRAVPRSKLRWVHLDEVLKVMAHLAPSG
jgi:probable F420-dependent oxidoreductase